MNKAQQKRFNSLYQKQVSALTRQGKAATTIDLYSRAVAAFPASSTALLIPCDKSNLKLTLSPPVAG